MATATRARTKPAARFAAIALGLALTAAAACGSQRSQEDLLAAAQAAGSSSAEPAAQGGAAPDGSVPGTESSATTVAGQPAASTPGATTPAAGGGGGNQASASARAATGPATGAPILIGSVGDYTGLVGAPAQNMIPTLQTWARWLNDTGGINGRPVQFVFADAGSDPARNLSIVRDMVERKHVVAFVHNQQPLSGQGSLQYLQEHQIPVIGGDMVASFWNENPMLFPEGTGGRSIFTGFSRLAVQAGKKIAIFYCVEADFICGYGRRVMVDEGVVAKAGGTVVYQAQISIAQPSFTTECLQARDRGAEVVVIFNIASGVRAVARSCDEQGYKPSYVTGSLALTSELENVPSLIDMHAPVQVAPWIANDTPGLQLFHKVMAAYGPKVPVAADSSYAWTSAQLFAKVARIAGEEVSSKTLLDALYSLKDETLDGLTVPLNFKRGQATPAFDCYFEVAISGEGKYFAPKGSTPICG